MLRKILVVAVLIGCLASTVNAQDTPRVASPFNRMFNPVADAEIVQNGDNLELVVTGRIGHGCPGPTIINAEPVGNTWFIDIYRDVPFETVCPDITQSVPYEERIEANFLRDVGEKVAQIMVVAVNGKFFLVQPTGDEALPVTLIAEVARGLLPYQNITLRHTQEGDMEITLSGSLSDSCPIPVYRAVPDWQNEGFVMVEAYTAIDIAAMCMQAIVPFEVVFRSSVFDSVAINGVSVPFSPEMSVDIQRFVEQPLPVTAATAEWVEGFQPNLKITVTGTVDGCDFPIQLVPQKPVDNTQVVKVVRVLPDGIECTMIAREFTEEIHITPEMPIESPLTLYVGNQTVDVEPK